MPRKSRTPPPPPEEEPSGASREPDAEGLTEPDAPVSQARPSEDPDVEPFSPEWFAALEARATYDPTGAAQEFLSLRALDERRREESDSPEDLGPVERNTPEWFAELERERVASGLPPFGTELPTQTFFTNPDEYEPFTPEWFAALELSGEEADLEPVVHEPLAPAEHPRPSLPANVLDGRVEMSDDLASQLEADFAQRIEQFSPEWFAQIGREDANLLSKQSAVEPASDTPESERPPSATPPAPPTRTSPPRVPVPSATTPVQPLPQPTQSPTPTLIPRQIPGPRPAPATVPLVAAKAVQPVVAALLTARGASETERIEADLAAAQEQEQLRVEWEADAWEMAAAETLTTVDVPRPYTSRDDAVWATVKRAAARETTTWETYSAAYRRLAEVRLAWETRARAFAATTVIHDTQTAMHRAEAATSTAHRHAVVAAVTEAVVDAGQAEAAAWTDYETEVTHVDQAVDEAREALNNLADAELKAQLAAEQAIAARAAVAAAMFQALSSELAALESVDDEFESAIQVRAAKVADLNDRYETEVAVAAEIAAAQALRIETATRLLTTSATTDVQALEALDSEFEIIGEARASLLVELTNTAEAEALALAQQLVELRQAAQATLSAATTAEIESVETTITILDRYELARSARNDELETIAFEERRVAAERRATLRIEVASMLSQRSSVAITTERNSETTFATIDEGRLAQIEAATRLADEEALVVERRHRAATIKPLLSAAGEVENQLWNVFEAERLAEDAERSAWEVQARSFALDEETRHATEEANRRAAVAAQKISAASLAIAEQSAIFIGILAQLDEREAAADAERLAWAHDAQRLADHELAVEQAQHAAALQASQARRAIAEAIAAAAASEIELVAASEAAIELDSIERFNWETQARELAAHETSLAIERQAAEARDQLNSIRSTAAAAMRVAGADEALTLDIAVSAFDTDQAERTAWEAQARTFAAAELEAQQRAEASLALQEAAQQAARAAEQVAKADADALAAARAEAQARADLLAATQLAVPPVAPAAPAAPVLPTAPAEPFIPAETKSEPANAPALISASDLARLVRGTGTRTVREYGAQDAQLAVEMQRRAQAEHDARDLAAREHPPEAVVEPTTVPRPNVAPAVQQPLTQHDVPEAPAAPVAEAARATSPFDELSEAKRLAEEAQARLARAREAALRRAEPLSVSSVGELPPESTDPTQSPAALLEKARLASEASIAAQGRLNAEADAVAAAEARVRAEADVEAQAEALRVADEYRRQAARSQAAARIRQFGGASMRELFELEELLHEEERDRTDWLADATRVAREEHEASIAAAEAVAAAEAQRQAQLDAAQAAQAAQAAAAVQQQSALIAPTPAPLPTPQSPPAVIPPLAPAATATPQPTYQAPVPQPPAPQAPAYSPPPAPLSPAAAAPQWGAPVPPVPPPPSMVRGPQGQGPLTGAPSRSPIPGRTGSTAPHVGVTALQTYETAQVGRVSQTNYWAALVYALSGLAIASAIVRLGLLSVQYVRIGAEAKKAEVTSGLFELDRLVDTSAIMLLVSLVFGLLFFTGMLFGASRNLVVFGRQDQQWAPFVAIVPLLVWAPMVNEVWKGSDFRVRANDPSWQDGKGNSLAWVWWVSLVVGIALLLSTPLAPNTVNITLESIDRVRRDQLLAILCCVAWIFSGMMTLQVTRQVATRQEQCRKAREQSLKAHQRAQNARPR